MTITIPLAPVTKKNSNEIHVNHATGRRFVAPSQRFKDYQAACGYFIMRGDVKPVTDYPVNIKCLFYMPTKRRVDLTNLLEAIDDVLVHYGVIEDDDNKHLAGHDGSRVLYDKENPRTEIYISRLEEIPRGKWVNISGYASECSICKTREFFPTFNFCPNCGAQMLKEGETCAKN